MSELYKLTDEEIEIIEEAVLSRQAGLALS